MFKVEDFIEQVMPQIPEWRLKEELMCRYRGRRRSSLDVHNTLAFCDNLSFNAKISKDVNES